MADLLLDSLEIWGFRAFKHLEIERLGRVNLIVGKNGVGKTALLEAIRVYTYEAVPSILFDIVTSRGEKSFEEARTKIDVADDPWYLALRHIFHAYPDLLVDAPSFSVGPLENAKRGLTAKFDEVRSGPVGQTGPHLLVKIGDLEERYSLLGSNDRRIRKKVKNYFVYAHGLQDEEIGSLWDDIALTDSEEIVLDALNLVTAIRRLSFIQAGSDRIPVVRHERFSDPIPLASLGAGMLRMLGISLALVNAKGGTLLIDEVETGLHFTVQPEMWKLIFETAQRLNVQVFATTHSLDCLRAFEHAASQYGEEESMLISLRRHQEDPERIVAVLADKEKLDTIIHSHIEVR